ncbi:HU family DNA-binding protein [Paracoccus litorisediminis]|uniref:HU family DNA-binding protein n=1 Tax=Paracoccus litorisediminis TaxID=2006130 RepID=UPI00372F18A8
MSDTMNKAALIAAVAEKANIDKKAAGAALEGLIEVMKSELAAGRPLSVLGTFKVAPKDTPAREVRVPGTGETRQKPAGRTVKISAMKSLKDVFAA